MSPISLKSGRLSMDRYNLEGEGHMTDGSSWASPMARELIC